MIDFQRMELSQKALYDQYLMHCGNRGCEYSFVNKFLWGRQKAAFVGNYLVCFSQFDRRSVYPFPIGEGDLKPVLDAIIHDARARGIPCCITGMTENNTALLENLYPGAFRFYTDRDDFDYVYAIDDLADLKGRKFQKKRNHMNKFQQNHPEFQVLPLDEKTRAAAFCFANAWYQYRQMQDPHMDFHLEKIALERAFAFQSQLELEGMFWWKPDKFWALPWVPDSAKIPLTSILRRPGKMWMALTLPQTGNLPGISGRNIRKCAI